MRRLFEKDDFSDLEEELSNGRPEPRAEFVRELVGRVGQARPSAPRRRRRVALAVAFATVVIVVLAAFGGIGYAKSSVVAAAKSSGHVVSSVIQRGNDRAGANGGNHGGDDDPWVHQYSHFVLVCYPFRIRLRTHTITVYRTIVVPRSLLSLFVPPGTEGACRLPHG